MPGSPRRPITRAAVMAISLSFSATLVADERIDLGTAYRLAVEDDPGLRASQARLRASEELTPQARALFLPRIDLETSADRAWENRRLGDLDRDSVEATQIGAGVTLTQPLFRMESFAVADQSAVLHNQAGLEYARSQQDILLRVSEAYFDVLLAQDTLRLTEAEREAVASERRRAERALEVGSGTVTDRDEAQARFDQVEAQRLRARNDLRIAQQRFQRLVGHRPESLAGLREDFEAQPPEPADAEVWAERARSKNLGVRLAEEELQRSRTEIRRVQGERYPRVDLVARYNRNYQSDSLGFAGGGGGGAGGGGAATGFGGSLDQEQTTVGVRMTMPLFAGGGDRSRTREARAERDAFFEDSVDVRRDASIEAESAYLNLMSNLRQITALEQALQSAESTERSTRRGVEVGLRTTVDLLNVQRDRFATERDLAEARYGYLLNYLQLQAAVGSAVDATTVDDVNFFLAAQPEDEIRAEPILEPEEDADAPATGEAPDRGGD